MIEATEDTTTVAQYLKTRLEQLGLDRMFGVAGNYTAGFLDSVLSDAASPIEITGSPNEICAGFAADAYARYTGIGALYVTYSVGAFTLLNTIAGSYVERVPVLLVNGAPTAKEDSIERNAGLLYSHTTGYELVDIHMFRPITAGAERITDARRATFQIDSVLTAMLTESRPGYLEVAEDVWRAACAAPQGQLHSGVGASMAVASTDDAVSATMALLEQRPRVVLWGGLELVRHNLRPAFEDLLDALDGAQGGDAVGFVTTPQSKGLLSERHPRFKGCVTLRSEEIRSLVGDDGCLIGVGGWTTSKDTGSQNIRGPGTVLAANGHVIVGGELFPLVRLDDYVSQLTAALRATDLGHLRSLSVPTPPQPVAASRSDTSDLSYDSFFSALDQWLTADDVLVVDAGFPLIGAQPVTIPEAGGFLAQSAWLSIGYSVPAATGVAFANPDKRAVVVVGDGAFHENCQAVSDHSTNRQNTIVFVLSNGLYGIEQYLVNPNPFRGDHRVDYPDALENEPYSYNVLPRWDFVALATGFGAEGRTVTDPDGLRDVLAETRRAADRNFVIEIVLPQVDLPAALAKAAPSTVGEDEVANPDWPPAGKF